MLKDQSELLLAFNECGVDHLVVDGQAVNFHGVPRLTKNVDILIRSSQANSEAVYRELAKFGAPVKELSPADFQDHPETIIQFGVPSNRIDLMQSIGTLTFEQAWQNRVRFAVNSSVSADFISLDDLICNKIETGRHQDLADAEQLQKLKAEL